MVTRQNPLRVGWLARRTVEFAAAEAYPLEVAGFIIGDTSAEAAVSITKYFERRQVVLSFDEESIAIAEDIFNDMVLGEFHSHPGIATGKSIAGVVNVYRGIISDDDANAMEDDDIEWVVSVWPGKRKWCFRHRIYSKHEGKIRTVPVRWNSATKCPI